MHDKPGDLNPIREASAFGMTVAEIHEAVSPFHSALVIFRGYLRDSNNPNAELGIMVIGPGPE